MTILYFGDDAENSTCYHRAQALRRLGHDVLIFNPATALSGFHSNGLFSRFHYRTGYRFTDKIFLEWLGRILVDLVVKPDLCWVNSGEFFSRKFVQTLRALGCPVILYNNDDPTGSRDGALWHTLLRALTFYDLCITRRHPTEVEMLQRGARKTLRVSMSYDEVIHRPPAPDEPIPEHFFSDLTFVGTWMQKEARHVILRQLHEAGLKVNIWGGLWHKCPDQDLLAKCWQGRAISGRDYVNAIAGAKISLGLLSHGNRDQHTRRSVEIPYCGGLLCAERTPEHLELYEEGKEAVFWESPEECLRQCSRLIADETLRESIRQGGMAKVRQLKVGNENVCQQILDHIFNGK
jgi:spore maturation protein CgeB